MTVLAGPIEDGQGSGRRPASRHDWRVLRGQSRRLRCHAQDCESMRAWQHPEV